MIRSTFKTLFYINRSKEKKNGNCPIMGRITIDGKQVQYSMGKEIAPELWDSRTKMMWKDGGNSEVLHSSNASLRRVTVFSECSNTVWAYNPIFYISKVCLCTTNCRLYHKDPCPERGLNHSEVVIRKQ